MRRKEYKEIEKERDELLRLLKAIICEFGEDRVLVHYDTLKEVEKFEIIKDRSLLSRDTEYRLVDFSKQKMIKG